MKETVIRFPALSRDELAMALCENLNWTTPKGEYRRSACLRTLETLEQQGVLTLPAKRNPHATAKRQQQAGQPVLESTPAPDPAPFPPPIACDLADLKPLALVAADSSFLF